MKFARYFRPLFRLSVALPQRYPLSNHQKLNKQPFFIINAGRSGSTVLAALLDKHSQVCMPPEQFVLAQVIVKFRLFNWMQWDDLSALICSEFIRSKASQGWNINGQAILDKALELPVNQRSLEALLNLIYGQYAEQSKGNFSIWGDKTPINHLYFDLILKVFPHARYVGLVRDGRDVVGSYMIKDHPKDFSYATRKWNGSIKMMDYVQSKVNKTQFMLIKYDDLVNQPQATLESVQKLLQLPIEDLQPELGANYLDKLKTVGHTDAYQNVSNPLNKRSIGKWKDQFSDQELSVFLPEIEKNLKRFGYL